MRLNRTCKHPAQAHGSRPARAFCLADGILCTPVNDELTSLKSAQFIRDHVNDGRDAPKARLAVLSDSDHMICIDNEREDVARQVTGFLGAA